MDEKAYQRNLKISNLLGLWEWCSRRHHVKWRRKEQLRNGCIIGISCAVSGQTSISGPALIKAMELPQRYRDLSKPLLNQKRVRTFWKVKPVALLDLCLGVYTKGSPLAGALHHLRSIYQDNPTLDGLAKIMRDREKRLGSDWYADGHHPEREFRLLKKEMFLLCEDLRNLMTGEHATVEKLGLKVLALGWQLREIPAAWKVRRTPEKLLNRATRLKLWRAAREILAQELDDEKTLETLVEVLRRKLTPSVKAAIKAQGYTVDHVVDDMLNFDMRKTRAEIVA